MMLSGTNRSQQTDETSSSPLLNERKKEKGQQLEKM